jgi:hypothetical protein
MRVLVVLKQATESPTTLTRATLRVLCVAHTREWRPMTFPLTFSFPAEWPSLVCPATPSQSVLDRNPPHRAARCGVPLSFTGNTVEMVPGV